MITEKQKLIAEQAVYGDLMGYGLQDGYYKKNLSTIAGFQGQLVYIGCDVNKVDSIKPILRPLSDLTKEITHKGYNENQPFIPLVELAKVNTSNSLNEYKILSKNTLKYDRVRFFYDSVRNEFGKVFDVDQYLQFPNIIVREPVYQQICFDLLRLWHFDTRGLLEKSEAISTDEVNPYEVNRK